MPNRKAMARQVAKHTAAGKKGAKTKKTLKAKLSPKSGRPVTKTARMKAAMKKKSKTGRARAAWRARTKS